MQLVGPTVVMYDTMKDKRIGRAEVIEKFGVGPEKVIEVQALIGDTSDNVPGVPGIGPKTAAELITQYGDLETVLKRAKEIKQDKRRESLIQNADAARISKKLVTLDTNVKLDVPVDQLAVHEPDYKNLIAFLKAMGFRTMTQRVAAESGVDADAVTAGTKLLEGPSPDTPALPPPRTGQLDLGVPPSPARKPAGSARQIPGALTPISLAEARAQAARHAKIDRSKYECVRTLARLKEWIARAHELGVVAVDTETTSLDAMQAELCGFSLALAPNEACYVPLGHREGGGKDDLFSPQAKLCEGQILEQDALKALKPLLEDKAVLKVAQNMKYDWLVFAQRGIEIRGYDDTMLISYVLDAGKGGHGMDDLAKRWLDHDTIHFQHVAGSGKNQVTFDCVSIEKATDYAAEDADVTLRLWNALKPRLASERVTSVYETLERSMPDVLARMERRGISIRADAGAPGRRDQDAGRRATQSGIAQAARRHSVWQNEAAGRKQNQDRPMVDRRARAGGSGRARPRAAAQDPRLAAGVEAALDLYRSAAELRQPDDASRAHELRARRDLDRAPVVV